MDYWIKQITWSINKPSVDIDKDKVDLISDVQSYRNELVHYMPKYNEKEAASKLVNLYDFMLYFSRKHLKQDIISLIPKRFYKIFNGLLKEWDIKIKEANKEASREKKVEHLEPCPVCHLIGTVSKKTKRAYCHLCNSDLFIFDCEHCKNISLQNVKWDLNEEHPEILCHSCNLKLWKEIREHMEYMESI